MYHSSRRRTHERTRVGAAEILVILVVLAAIAGLLAWMIVEGAAPGGPVPWTALG